MKKNTPFFFRKECIVENNDRNLCIEAFDSFLKVVKEFTENQGFCNLGPCVFLVGEKNVGEISPEVLVNEDTGYICQNMSKFNKDLGSIIGIGAGIHVVYSIPTEIQIGNKQVFEAEDYYSVMSVILDRNGGNPKERTLVMDGNGAVHHVDKMAYPEIFQEPLRRMKTVATCITAWNAAKSEK